MNFSKFFCIVFTMASLTASGKDVIAISTKPFGDSMRHWYMIDDKDKIIQPKKDQPRYNETQIAEIADNMLLYQRSNGGWLKNYDMQAILTKEQKDSLIQTKDLLHTTIDNSTTYTQIDYLAQTYNILRQEKYKKGALDGIKYLIKSQYANGGFPQFYPLEKGKYSEHITFNDGAFIGVMKLFQKIEEGDSIYSFLDQQTKKDVHQSYQKGIDCILKCQINENGALTAWCQQHDETTFVPIWARAFEPPSICNGESAEIVLFLMSLKNPSSAIIKSIQSAEKWFEDSAIKGIRIETVNAPTEQTRYKVISTDKVLVKDETAPLIWTRYYELGTHRPLFCDRNSKFLYQLSDVSRERRVGYAWYVYGPQKVIDIYPKWCKANGI